MTNQSITLQGTLDENRRLIIYVPAGIEVTSVEVQIRPTPADAPSPPREAARARLKAAGLFSEVHYAPPQVAPVSSEEFERLTHLFAGRRLASDLIDEDRGAP